MLMYIFQICRLELLLFLSKKGNTRRLLLWESLKYVHMTISVHRQLITRLHVSQTKILNYITLSLVYWEIMFQSPYFI